MYKRHSNDSSLRIAIWKAAQYRCTKRKPIYLEVWREAGVKEKHLMRTNNMNEAGNVPNWDVPQEAELHQLTLTPGITCTFRKKSSAHQWISAIRSHDRYIHWRSMIRYCEATVLGLVFFVVKSYHSGNRSGNNSKANQRYKVVHPIPEAFVGNAGHKRKCSDEPNNLIISRKWTKSVWPNLKSISPELK